MYDAVVDCMNKARGVIHEYIDRRMATGEVQRMSQVAGLGDITCTADDYVSRNGKEAPQNDEEKVYLATVWAVCEAMAKRAGK